jgi:hypothetical protein
MEDIMKHTIPFTFLFVLVIMFVSCSNEITDNDDNKVTIHGTVTIMRNNIPWNIDNFPPHGNYNYDDDTSTSRQAPPPEYRPYVRLFTNSIHDICLGESYAYTIQDFAAGRYQWSIKIPADKLPCIIFSDISWWMPDTSADASARTEGIWVTDKNTPVDFEPVNTSVIEIHGNLPITVNGEADYGSAVMNISGLYSSSLSASVTPDGYWSRYIMQPSSETPLKFSLTIIKDGGIFKKDLNPDDTITVYDADKEITFPSNPAVNFQAYTLSGVVKIITPPLQNEQQLGGALYFYEKEIQRYTEWEWNNAYVYLNENNIQYQGDGYVIQWRTMIPAFSFPQKIPYYIYIEGEDPTNYTRHMVYSSISSVEITEDTDLSKIELNVITLK